MSTKRWLGNAASVTDLWTITLSGTVTSQVYSVTINGKSVTYSAGGSDTASVILLALATALQSTSNPPEFLELTAAALPDGGPYTSVTLTQNTAGVPSTISVSTSGAATFSITNTTVATGPNFFDNGQNWSGGSAPANSDTLVFDNGNVACKYNLSTTLTGITLLVNPQYTGQIGLPLINATTTTTYAEYRTTSLTLDGGTAIINGPSLGMCNLDFGSSHAATVRVLATGSRLNNYTPVVLLTGGDASSELDITKGDVATAFYQDQTASFPTIKTGYDKSPQSDVSLIVGAGTTVTTLTKSGGSVTVKANVTTLNQDLSGGDVTITDSATVGTLNVYAGTCYLNTVGTVTTINLYGGAALTADGDPRAKTVTNSINVYSQNVKITDNQKSINSGTLTLATHGAVSVGVSHGANTTIVYT